MFLGEGKVPWRRKGRKHREETIELVQIPEEVRANRRKKMKVEALALPGRRASLLTWEKRRNG